MVFLVEMEQFFCFVLFFLPGQHDCVTVINNFFSRSRLEYYTKAQGLETEPKLLPKLAGPLHKIIMTTNLSPVKVVAGARRFWLRLAPTSELSPT